MSGTTSSISIMFKNKIIQTIFTNYDGYLSHTGKHLLKRYSNINQIQKLIDAGNISCLDSDQDHSDNNPAKFFFFKKDYDAECKNHHFNYLFKEENSTWYLMKYNRYFKLSEEINKLDFK